MALTQENLPLKIQTPLGTDKLLVESLSATESMSGLFQMHLELVSEDENIQPQQIIGQNVTVSVEIFEGEPRFFNGFVSRFSQSRTTLRVARYRAEVVPWFWFLTKAADCRIYQEKSVADVLREVFQFFNFSDFELNLGGVHDVWEYCVWYQETAFNFCSRLMEQEGIFHFLRHENGKHVMVLGDQSSVHKPILGDATVTIKPSDSSGAYIDEQMIVDWRHVYEFRTGKYAQCDFNFKTPNTSLLSATQTKTPVGGNQNYEVFEFPGEYDTKGEGDRWTKVRMEEEEALYSTAWGNSTCRMFSPGFKFTLKDHPIGRENGGYILTSVSHTARQAGFYSEGGAPEFSYSNAFTCIPDSVPFRPPRMTRKPVIDGTQTAIVVGPSGEEIYTDEHGRVKLQFHWDREGKYDQNSSCWVRVSHAWAGKGWGSMVIPRIGQEVIVAFEVGDPDRPIIVGRVYNAEQTPPYELPGKQNITSIKSYSTKGGGGFNEIRLDDTKGSEQIFIHGQKDYHLRVKEKKYQYIGTDSHLIVKTNQMAEVKGDQHTKVVGDCNEQVGGTVSLKAGMDLQQKVGMKYALDAGMEIHLKSGLNLVIEAGTSLTLKVGGNFININPGGVFISGTMVFINSGGAAGSGAGCSPQAPTAPDEADEAEGGSKAAMPPAKQPPKPSTYSPQAAILKSAAQKGTPFCEVCGF